MATKNNKTVLDETLKNDNNSELQGDESIFDTDLTGTSPEETVENTVPDNVPEETADKTVSEGTVYKKQETPKVAEPDFISVDDGSERVPIMNRAGDEIGVFYFRPTDIGIIARYNKVAKDFADITAPLENINIAADGTTSDEDEVSALNEAEKRLYDAVDYLFGGNLSEAFFGKMHPFSPVNGAFYCENALSAVGKYIARRFDMEVSKIQKNVSRYTHGYQSRTGKHKNGRT